MSQFKNVVKFPATVGITGQSIKENRIMYYNEGDKMFDYLPEVDNSLGIVKVESLMIAPIRCQ